MILEGCAAKLQAASLGAAAPPGT